MNMNRASIDRCLEAFNSQNFDAVADLFAEDLINHAAIPEAQGRAGLFRIWTKLWTAFPDLSWTYEDVIEDGDRIVCRMRMRGTNRGPLHFALLPLPATGKTIDCEAISIFRFADGRIAEHWGQRDEIRMLRQLGRLTLGGSTTDATSRRICARTSRRRARAAPPRTPASATPAARMASAWHAPTWASRATTFTNASPGWPARTDCAARLPRTRSADRRPSHEGPVLDQ